MPSDPGSTPSTVVAAYQSYRRTLVDDTAAMLTALHPASGVMTEEQKLELVRAAHEELTRKLALVDECDKQLANLQRESAVAPTRHNW